MLSVSLIAALVWYYKNRDNIQHLSDKDKEKMSSISIFVRDHADWIAGFLAVATLCMAHKIDANLQANNKLFIIVNYFNRFIKGGRAIEALFYSLISEHKFL